MERSITINRPLAEVFAFVMDSANWPKWEEELKQVRQSSEGPVGVGTTFRGTADFMGQMDWRAEIVEYEPQKKVVQRMTVGPMEAQGAWLFEPVENGTRFTMRLEAEGSGLFNLARPFIEGALKSRVEADLARLKAMIEEEDQGV
jgi:uncharacterized membrane protein